MSDPDTRTSTQVVRGVGALAAETVAEAAALVATLARQAGQSAATAEAEGIRARSSALSVSIELVYTRASRELATSNRGHSDQASLAQTLANAADAPLRVCQLARNLVLLATDLATGALPERRSDLSGVVQLAAGACACAALLVQVNRALDAHDPRWIRASQA